jgi:ATP-binding cassette subfamily C protein CydD
MKANIPKHIQKASLKWLFKEARTARGCILLSIVLGFSGGMLLIWQARLIAKIVHGAFMDATPRAELLPLFVSLAVVIGLRALIGWGRETAGFQAGAKVRTAIRQQLLEQITQKGPGYVSGQHTAALTTAILEHVEGLHDFFAHYLPQLALAVMLPLAILAFVFPISWAAGALFLFTAPLIPVFMILVGMGAESISQRHHQSLARMSAHFLDVLQGLTTLKLFGQSRHEAQNIARVSSSYRRRTMGVLRVAFLSSAVLEFFSSISIALVAVYLGMSYLGYIDFGRYGETLSLASGFFILLLAPDFYFPLRELGTYYHARAEAVGAAQELQPYLSGPRRTYSQPFQAVSVKDTFPITFQDVRLTYEEGRRSVLKGIDFTLNTGEQVALIGPSGVGKTTILNLLLGFLAPSQGRIQAADRNLEDIGAAEWLKKIGWIGQQPMLFHGTIKQNIQMGRMDATADEIETAAHAAAVLEFTRKLPQGLDTPVGEQGWGLSRGQAQRVALARVFLKNAPLLLLDEPTAGLDTENEQLVLKALEALSKNKSLLLLTHRLIHLEKMDRIMVLADGQIQENGSFRELMQKRSLFYDLVQQAQGGRPHGNLA